MYLITHRPPAGFHKPPLPEGEYHITERTPVVHL